MILRCQKCGYETSRGQPPVDWYDGPTYHISCNGRFAPVENRITRDSLLAEISRSLRATHPDRAEEIIREVEKRMPADFGGAEIESVAFDELVWKRP